MSEILTYQHVSEEIFKGRAVPSPNTVTVGEHRGYNRRVINHIKSIIRQTTLPDDDYGDLHNAAVILYEQCLKKEELKLPDSIVLKLKRRYRSVPLVVHDPTEY